MSHSVLNDMETIQQAPPSKSGVQQSVAAKLAAIDNDSFFSEYSTNMYDCSNNISGTSFNAVLDRDKSNLEFVDAEDFDKIVPIDSMHTNVTSMFHSGENRGISNDNKKQTTSNTSSLLKSTSSSKQSLNNKSDENTAQKRFGNAKGFGSAQFFADNQYRENDSAKLERFQGSNAISSADFFTDETHASNYNSKGCMLIYIVIILLFYD